MIVFEGMSGSGKSFIIKQLHEHWDKIDAVTLRASHIFGYLKNTNYINYNNKDYYLLFDRLKTILFVDSPKPIVLFERYYLSTLAHTYSVACENGDYSIHNQVLEWYKNNIGDTLHKPDAYFYFKIPIGQAADRIRSRCQPTVSPLWVDTKYMMACEQYKLDFISKYEPDVPIYFVDSTYKPEVIQSKIMEYIHEVEKV